MADGNRILGRHFENVAFETEASPKRRHHHRIVVDGVTQPGYATIIPGRKTAIHDERPHIRPGGFRSMG